MYVVYPICCPKGNARSAKSGCLRTMIRENEVARCTQPAFSSPEPLAMPERHKKPSRWVPSRTPPRPRRRWPRRRHLRKAAALHDLAVTSASAMPSMHTDTGPFVPACEDGPTSALVSTASSEDSSRAHSSDARRRRRAIWRWAARPRCCGCTPAPLGSYQMSKTTIDPSARGA